MSVIWKSYVTRCSYLSVSDPSIPWNPSVGVAEKKGEMATRREDDSYTNGGSVFEASVEDGRKDDTMEVYDGEQPDRPADDDVALCGMPMSVSFVQQVTIIQISVPAPKLNCCEL